jgi:DeoR family glycerol-3-phosphate regulon repressor
MQPETQHGKQNSHTKFHKPHKIPPTDGEDGPLTLPMTDSVATAGRLSARQREILRLVKAQGRLGVAELAERLQVSEETVRRDVRPMAASGVLRKLHGAVGVADATTEPPLTRRMEENVEAKMRIAALAAAQIADGDSIMLDTGSTTIFVAHALAERRRLMVVTNSTEVARVLSKTEGSRVFLAGGEIRGDDAAVFGPQTVAFVGQFVARTAILSIGGIDAVHGLTDYHVGEAEFSQAVIPQVDRVIVVADHAKFSRRGFARVCGFEQIDMLITDAPPPPDAAARLADSGVTVLVAD